ncbi:hypothetical protein YC2023_046895 [Brassica napus]
MGGGMETNKNKFIEDWGSARENLEHNFRWTRRNFALIGIFGIALPIIVYKGIVKDFCNLCVMLSGALQHWSQANIYSKLEFSLDSICKTKMQADHIESSSENNILFCNMSQQFGIFKKLMLELSFLSFFLHFIQNKRTTSEG